LYDIAGGSALTPRQWIGIGLALTAVILVGTDSGHEGVNARIVARAVLAGVGFGLFFIALSQTSPDSGLWPLVGARMAAVPLAFAAAFATRSYALPHGRDIAMLALIGCLDMSANIAIALALQIGPVGINAVLSSLYPVVTAIAAIIVLRERPSTRQILAVAFAMGAIVALAI
jgi:drug/metabolite transporter (DMT)-like permease